jgi:alpha-tubulin suppressor-like RCC1 family protein
MNVNPLRCSVIVLALYLSAAVPVSATVRYVRLNNAAPVSPYTSWATAATNIQDAINVAVDGDRILVTNGVYQAGGRVVYGSLTNRVAVTKALTVQSVNGPGVTAIVGYQMPGTTNGDSAVRCVYLTNNAALIGFTLTNGATRCLCSGTFGLPDYVQEQSGGAVWAESASAVVSNCVITANAAFGNAGGAYSGTFQGCFFAANRAGVYGGGAFNSTLQNCALTGNASGNAGGGVNSCTLNNCTLIGNSSGAMSATLNNCIIYYNTAWNASGSTASNCCTTPDPGGGSITNEPQMADFSHISAVSPCRGAGNPAWAAGPDIDGESWSNPPAIGCDEYRAGNVVGALSVAILAPYTNATPGFALGFTAQINGHAGRNRWDWGDGSGATNRLFLSHSWATAGNYPVTLRVYNDSHPAGVSASTMVHIAAETHYVNPGNPSPSPPYTSWATAATNIQNAIDAAVLPGAVVLVTNGLYQTGGRVVYGAMTNRVAVTKPITVQSVNGPAVTTIQGYQVPGATNGDAAVRCVWLTNNAALIGFTLTNGATRAAGDGYQEQCAGGVLCLDPSSVVSNCVVAGNSAYALDSGYGAGGGGGGGVMGGTLYNCRIVGNSAPNGNGGGAHATSLYNCILARNVAGYGGGAYQCTLDHCWITNNSAGQGGGSYGYGAALNNCLVTGNSAGYGGGVFGGALHNCTVAGNVASTEGGGAWNAGAANSIIYSNSAPAGANWFTGSYAYCCTDPAYDIGAFSAPPLFVNQAGGDFHLQPVSPCINTADNGSVGGSVDLDGNPRIIGPTVDVGAYEYQLPTIAFTVQPTNQMILKGQGAVFAAAAVSPFPLSYRWYFQGAALADGGEVAGSGTASLSLSNIQTNDGGSYQVIVTNHYLAATSAVAVLTVLVPPMVVVQPTNQAVQFSSNATFAVSAIGSEVLAYQWFCNGTALADGGRVSGSTTANLTIQNSQSIDIGTYQVVVTNNYGMTSSVPATLMVLAAPPVITRPPANLFEPLNANAVFAGTASGTEPLSYQWYFNGAPLLDGGRTSGSRASTLTISNLQTNDQGQYQFIVTNNYGAATSSLVKLTVLLNPVSKAGVVSAWGWGDVGQTGVPGDATNIVAIAAGYNHALALRSDGTVEAWGESYLGATSVPGGLSNVVAIAGGDNHSLALLQDGTVVAWGDNGYGQATVPAGLSNVVAIAAGNFFSLALKSDGSVTGWGNNGNQQLLEAGNASGIMAIAANPVNTGYALGLKTDGTVVEWGLSLPPAPAGLTNVIRIAAGGSHYMALKGDGTVVAWGDNTSGQTNVPAGLSNVVAIAAGWMNSLALKGDGTVVVWGGNTYSERVNPFGLTNVTAIAAGGGYNLVLNNGLPGLLAWPTNQAIYTGMSAGFSAAPAPAAVSPALQWQLNGSNILSATGGSLNVTNAQLSDAGTYSVVVTNLYGSITSSASLSVSASKPVIGQQPADQWVTAGSNAAFAVTAIGSLPLAYQWQCNLTNLPAQTNAALVLTNVQPGQSGLLFGVVVSNAEGAVASSNALLTVVPGMVAIQPQNLATNGGATVTFSSTVIGQGPFLYQWQFSGTNLDGATNSTLTLTNALASQSGLYRVIASNAFGTAGSSNAALTVVPWISISIAPAAITSGAGTLVIFSFNVGGLSPVTYQWTHDGAPWSGPNPGGALNIIDPPPSWAGVYSVAASDAYTNLTSSNATLTIIPLAITAQPTNRGAWLGGAAQFRVTALGAAPVGYQWQFNGTNLPGENASSLLLTNVQASQFGPYDVMVTNAYTNITSRIVTLSLSEVAIWGYAANGETNLPAGLTNVMAVSGGVPGFYDCLALRRDGTAVTWANSPAGVVTAAVTNLVAVACAITAGPNLGLRPDGTVISWLLDTPAAVRGLSNIVAIAPYNGSYLALKTNGTLVNVGLAGPAPAIVTNLGGVVAVAVGFQHGLALKADGTVAAWGGNTYGQTNIPAGLSNVVAIAAGGYHNLALKADSTVVAWGRNIEHQINVPSGLGNVVAVAAGGYHSLALQSNGTVVAWGFNNYNQTNVPAALTNVIAIAAGLYHNLALIGTGPPVLRAASSDPVLVSNRFTLALPTQSGKVFALEYRNSLADTNWTALPLVAGNGTNLLLTDPAATNPQRFYRVRRW